MPRVMISYRNLPEQKMFALSLHEVFQAAGVSTWIDVNDIPPLSRWEEEIINGIKHSDFVVLCLSDDYYDSYICMMECYIARGYRKKILTLWVTETSVIPYWDSLPKHTETQGLEYCLMGGLHTHNFWGLSLSYKERIDRILQAVLDPISIDTHYDVYVSYRSGHADFATKIADNLNRKAISTFIMTRHVNIGDNFHEVGWNAMLTARFHVIVLAEDIVESTYVKNEIRVSRTKPTDFLVILPDALTMDSGAENAIRQSFKGTEFDLLNSIQWLNPGDNFDAMMDTLVRYITNKSQYSNSHALTTS